MNGTAIPLLPEIPGRLRVAAKQGIIVPFVGAGVSQLCGCPGWDTFANAALRSFVKPGMLDYARFDQLSKLHARLKVSIAVGFERQYGQTIKFAEILEVHDLEKRKIGERIYGHLGRLARTFVTTNYDDWLDSVVAAPPAVGAGDDVATTTAPVTKRNVLYRLEDFRGSSLSAPNNVFHIHGSAAHRDSMLLTTSDYLSRYANHRLKGSKLLQNPYLEFLGHLFRTKSVLFVGYGLTELEILEYVIQKALGIGNQDQQTDIGPKEEPRHHILQGFFSHDFSVMLSMKDYFLREFNVQLLPFLMDEKGWDQLVDVVEYLEREIPANPLLSAEARHEMEGLLE